MAVLPLPPEDFARLALWRRLAIRMLVHPVTFFAAFALAMVAIKFALTLSYARFGAVGVIWALVIIVFLCTRGERRRY